MKRLTSIFVLLICLMATDIVSAQIRNQDRFGRQRTAIPQSQTPPQEPEPQTAEQMVDEQMPNIIESLELDPFEEAVMRATLVKYVQKRIELQILRLEPRKMKEAFDKLADQQNDELKAGLPEEKFQAYLDLQKNRFQAKKKKKKKKKKNKT